MIECFAFTGEGIIGILFSSSIRDLNKEKNERRNINKVIHVFLKE